MPKTEIIEYGEIKITVSEASILQGMRRSLMKQKAFENPDADEARQALLVGAFPDIISVTTGYEGMKEPNFEEFCVMDENLIDIWSRAVYKLNAHWYPMLSQNETQNEQMEKKL